MVRINKSILLRKVLAANRRRQQLLQKFISIAIARRRVFLKAISIFLLLVESKTKERAPRSCRRLHRSNTNWWNTVWTSYSDERFKLKFRVTRETFIFIWCRSCNKKNETVFVKTKFLQNFVLQSVYTVLAGDPMLRQSLKRLALALQLFPQLWVKSMKQLFRACGKSVLVNWCLLQKKICKAKFWM